MQYNNNNNNDNNNNVGLWIMDYGLWIMDYGSWIMDYGLRGGGRVGFPNMLQGNPCNTGNPTRSQSIST